MQRFDKQRIALRYYIEGVVRGSPDSVEWKRAYKMMALLENVTDGKYRKDGFTPERSHPIALALRSANIFESYDIGFAGDLVSICLGHDLLEDAKSDGNRGYIFNEIENICGLDLLVEMETLDKNKFQTTDSYYENLGNLELHLAAAIVKVIDRENNLSTMSGVFSEAKIQSYIQETEQYVIPLLKKIRRYDPTLSSKAEIIKFSIEQMMEIHQTYIIGDVSQAG